MPDPGTATDAFHCVTKLLPAIDAAGLKVAYALGGFNSTDAIDAHLLGGAAGGYGGITESAKGVQGYPTAREVEWAVRQWEKRNLSHVIAQFFLHDDDAAASGAVQAAVEWLRANAAHITPQTNTFPDSGPESLYMTRQFIFAPEEYHHPHQ